ncbi:hypothetical protein O0I10_000211 [Lichtheimia ornata]|uniref:Homeobox domain-containing protein n=1 Tax=Lichtheimia ornata TaxID=688661 RepID=A0AAD7Y555_9FUNG|nr:uncharacterized protein O0I10_000211 [Lichtheimia ornata]KAJ8663936.1 hypothetical protein O0I10_000211 [Lichtheimia ornata]
MSSTRNISSNHLCPPHLALQQQQQQTTNNNNGSSMSLSSSTSSLLSMYPSVDDLQQGFQPPPDSSQAYYGSSLTPSSIRDSETKTKSGVESSNSSSSQQPHGEFKATFYNPFETKHRRRTSPTQFRILEAAFEDNPKPSAAKRQSLAEELSMTARGVQIWFQNRRAKAKQQQQSDAVEESLSTSRKRQHGSEEDEKRQSHESNNKRRVAVVQKRSAGKPLYTEWDSQEPLHQQQHHSVTNEGQVHVTSSSPTSSHAYSSSSNSNVGDDGITGMHPTAASAMAHTRLQQQHSQTSVPPMCFATDTTSSSSSSPIDPAFELPMTPSMSPATSSMYDSYPTLHVRHAATASSMVDQQIYATTTSPCKPAWTSHHGFDEEAFPIESSFAYHHHPHQSTVSDWSPMSRSVSTPLLWQGSNSGDMQHNHHHHHHHHSSSSYLPVWASSTDEVVSTTPTTTTPTTPTLVVTPSSCVQPPLSIGVATSDATAADENKNAFDDLARFITAAVVDYSGTNISAPSSTPFDIRCWPELVSM